MDEEDEEPPRFAPRLSNIAVRRLGYTRTEAGFRRAGQIMDELEDLVRLEREAMEQQTRDKDDTLGWMTDENQKEVW
jgi:hypothetical protein